MIPVVYPYKYGDGGRELRYSLRSLQFLPHTDVWFVGDKPPWADNVSWIPRAHTGNSPADIVAGHVATAARALQQPFYLFNDDFFVLNPVEDVPVYHGGPIDKFIAKRKRRDTFGQSEILTGEYLRDIGITDPVTYALHYPLRIDADAFLEAVEAMPAGTRMRTWYGNVAGLGGWYAADCKVRDLESGLPFASFASTYERSFSEGKVGEEIRAIFPDRSPYEKESP